MTARLLVLLASALLLATCRQQPVTYGPYEALDRCAPAFGSALVGLGVRPGDVRGRTYTVRRDFAGFGGRFGRDDEVTGYEGWFRLTGCSGYLVVTANRYCQISQAYTRGDCAVPGVPAYGQ